MGKIWDVGDAIAGRWHVQHVFPGGMGRVFVVRDSDTGETLAAKTYRMDLLSETIIRRFEREAHAWIKVGRQRNVVHAKSFKIIDGQPLLFLEYMSGGTLRDFLASRTRTEYVSEDNTGDHGKDFDRLKIIHDLARQFCAGMVQMYDFGVTAHRDLKPTNCLLDGAVLKVADLGLAKSWDAADLPLRCSSDIHSTRGSEAKGQDTSQHTATWENFNVIITRHGAVAGTPAYMAPECFYGMEYSDTRSDVYSFGVMLFQMITGRLPFVADSWLDYMHLHEDAVPPTIPTAFEGLAGLVTRCLAKTPNERFADFRDVNEALGVAFYDPYETELWMWDMLVGQPLYGDEQSDADLIVQADNLKELGKYDEALNVLGHVVERDSKNGPAFKAMGILLAHKLRRFQEALHMFQQASKCGGDVEEQIAMCRRQMN